MASLFGEDDAGGHPNQSGQYHYHSMEFAAAWVGSGVASSPVVEKNVIAYLQSGLTHPDGHSRILGWMYDVRSGRCVCSMYALARASMRRGLCLAACVLFGLCGLPGLPRVRTKRLQQPD